MSFFGFGQSAEIDIVLNGADKRKQVDIKNEDGKKERLYLFYDGESVTGKVNVNLKNPGKKLEHQGIKIEFIGQIELFYDRGNHHEFTSLVRELARPGDLMQSESYDFEFVNVEKPYETYTGANVRLRYHLKDAIVGKIYFLLVRIKIKHMELAIIKRETTGTGPNTYNENETIAKYEIMDGAPVRGESIPIRLFLAGYELTPTFKDVNKKFSVRYFLNLVLVDEEERRYFKQQIKTLYLVWLTFVVIGSCELTRIFTEV
ncbi:Vacuolar protein sorting-associated protein 26B-like [Exaiptasia diaphana]|nr:Vacuolar protein sorting-associated protein 26B-like [Exaiptasia diaphana]